MTRVGCTFFIALTKIKNKMSAVVLVAIAAAIGNFLQGWDNSALAGKYLSQIKYAMHFCFYTHIYIPESFANSIFTW